MGHVEQHLDPTANCTSAPSGEQRPRRIPLGRVRRRGSGVGGGAGRGRRRRACSRSRRGEAESLIANSTSGTRVVQSSARSPAKERRT